MSTSSELIEHIYSRPGEPLNPRTRESDPSTLAPAPTRAGLQLGRGAPPMAYATSPRSRLTGTGTDPTRPAYATSLVPIPRLA